MKESARFEIVLQSPISLTTALQKDLRCSDIPKYRIVGIDVRRLGDEPGVFRLTTLIHPDDIDPEETAPSELYRVRDRIVSLFAVSAMAPVRPISRGLFTFHLGERRYKQTSLGPGKVEGPLAVLTSVEPLVAGQFLSERRAAAIYLIWQAINADVPLYRFINIAMCVDLIAADDSLEPNAASPICPKCGHSLEKCPDCQGMWTKIPTTLRNKARFLIGDERLLTRFISARNRVFHGSSELGDNKFRQELLDINVSLLVILRNYVGKEIGLSPIDERDLHWAVDNLSIHMSVYYTVPGQ